MGEKMEEIPKDGKWYRAWDSYYGACYVSWKDGEMLTVHPGDHTSWRCNYRIMRWQDEHGNWHEYSGSKDQV